jgi:hypothetical protein
MGNKNKRDFISRKKYAGKIIKKIKLRVFELKLTDRGEI